MKKLILFLIIIIIASIKTHGQTVTGKIINQYDNELSGIFVNLYVYNECLSSITDSEGNFYFYNVPTEISELEIPNDYHVSNIYPNPFNPTTRINITLPKSCNIKISIFNTIGQTVEEMTFNHLSKGNNILDINLEGLANGLYIANIRIDDHINITRKMVLLYGSQHLNNTKTYLVNTLSKINTPIKLDSLVISGNLIARMVLTNLTIKDTLLNLGPIRVHSFQSLSDCLLNPPNFNVDLVTDTVVVKDTSSCEYTCTVKKVTIGKNFEEIVLFSPMFSQDLWAGAIVSAKSLTFGMPRSINITRKPLTINLLGLLLTDNTRIIDDPYAGSVDAAISEILEKNWDKVNPTAIASYEYCETKTKNQVATELGLNGVLGESSFSGGFTWMGLDEVSSIFIKLIQRYYTVSIRKFNHYKDYIDTTKVNCKDIFDYLEPNDFPAIINEVSYGRIILVQMINTKGTSTKKMKASFEAIISGYADNEQTTIWNSSEKKALILGGSPEQLQFITSPDSILKIIKEGMRFSKESPGVALIYKSELFQKGLPPFSYGLLTDFIIKDCQLYSGDNLWDIYHFGCDCGHDNVYRLERDGTPICGTGNCPGAPNSCWANQQKIGGADGPGSININFGQDYQIYGSTWLFTRTNTNIPDIPYDADVGRVWLNDVEITNSPLQLHLLTGWNHLEFTCYNQNNGARLRISAPLANYVEIMDSNGCH